jgi:hypothetical protein
MSSPKQVSSYEDVLKRVRAMQSKSAAAQGDNVSDVKDPRVTGTVTPPTHPSESNTNAALPGGNPKPDNSAAPKSIESKQVVGTLEGSTPATVDGNAKDKAVDSPTAKLASSVTETVARVKGLLSKSAAEAPGTKSKADAADATEKGKVEASKKNGPEDLPATGAVATATDNGKKEAAANEAVASDIKLSPDAYIKLASALLESEEGLIHATRIIKEAKGAAVAAELINNALAAQEQFAKQAAAEEQGATVAEYLYKNASAEDRELMVKYAQVHGVEATKIDARADLSPEEKEMCKMAYAQGAMDGAAMADTGELPGGASEEPAPEDIIAVIEQLVASGQLPEEVAQQLIAELGAGGAAPGGAAPGGEALPGEGAETPVEETAEEKQASAKDPALALTGAHRKSASESDKLAAEILRASLPAAA